MPIWKMIIEIVLVVTAKPGNVINTKKKIMMMRIMKMRIMMRKMMKMTISEVSGRAKIMMMRIMMMKITMKMMKTIMKKVAGAADEVMGI
jgi:hypothetical protein